MLKSRFTRCTFRWTATLPAVLLVISFAGCETGPDHLTAEMPLHLEEHLDAATIERAVTGAVMSQRQRGAELRARLATLSPLGTLDRGYALIERADGSPVTSAGPLSEGERVERRLRDGRRPARIEVNGTS